MIKLFITLLELLFVLLRRSKAAKHDSNIQKINDDPVNVFGDKFGGLPNNAEPINKSLPGNKAGTEVREDSERDQP